MSDEGDEAEKEVSLDDKTSSVFDMDGGRPDFDGSPTTPDEGRIELAGEDASVQKEIERLQEEQPESYPHSDPGGVAYIPVGDSTLPYLNKRLESGKGFKVDGKQIGWWRKDGLMVQHPWLLLNPTTLANRNYHYEQGVARNYIDAEKGDVFILADSGGFQLVNSGMEIADKERQHDWQSAIHPKKIVEWQIANSDAGTILDVPVYNTIGETPEDWEPEHGGMLTDQYDEWYEDVFSPRLEMTKEHTVQAVERANEIGVDDFTLTAVLHGAANPYSDQSLTHSIREWFEEIDQLHDWDAWSLSTPYSDRPAAVTLLLAFAAEYTDDLDFIHVLGQGNIWSRLISKLYAKEKGTFVTMDGTGFKIGSMFSTMYVPTTYMKSLRVTDREPTQEQEENYESINVGEMPCACSVCRYIEKDMGGEKLFEKPGAERMVLMDMHNLNHLMRRFKLVDAFVADHGFDLLDQVTVNDSKSAGLPNGDDIKPYSEFWRLMLDWMTPAQTAEVYYCVQFLKRAFEEGVESAGEDFVIWSPFVEDSWPGAYNQENYPSILKHRTKSVYDW